MNAYLKRFKLGWSDRLRYSPLVRGMLARWKLWKDRIALPRDTQSLARSTDFVARHV
jgi:hypothetical protein